MGFAGKELPTPCIDVGLGNDGLLQQHGENVFGLAEAAGISWTAANESMGAAGDWNEYH